jgi:hypothetical protein
VNASDERALASVAAAEGFTYAWLPTESGVTLTRPGVRVVLYPGRLFYEVNNATPIADRAPTFNGEDLMISPALAARLQQIASEYGSSTAAPAVVERAAGMSRPVTIAAHLVSGRMALALDGTGTPGTSVTITLTGEISEDLPVVLIRRATVPVGADGSYSIEMGYGPDAHPKTTVTATATSQSGTDRAVTHVLVDFSPNGATSSALDVWPKD